MRRWEIIGLIATIVIILTIPANILKSSYRKRAASHVSQTPAAYFVGREKCVSCHKAEFDKWQNSHHDLAMDHATDETVLGDFKDRIFEHSGIRSRFFRKDSRFFVHTQGPGGKMDDFEITHVFGADPLQQYLVPFPGGRLQCLSIAWDVNRKRWYALYPDEKIPPDDWLHWTRGGQNWNGMCAECHSTNLRKGYDPESDTFETTWSEIDVSCEACHGPASAHVAWAEIPDMARPQVDNVALTVRTSGIDSRELVELCAPCHARRAALGDYTHAEADLLDSMLPSLLTRELYFSDGQILDEVYVYGSFTQSKMYHREVRCNDCHDVHSTKRVLEANALCLQCHRAGEYDTKAHHFHKQKGEAGDPIRAVTGEVLFEVGTGAKCVTCHMPGRHYMGIDYRPDHSFRIPRPDLSISLETPNACIRCHVDKTDQWADDTITKWYGPGRRDHYATIIDAGRKHQPSAHEGLIRLAGDALYPVIVRATALNLLAAYPGEDTARAMDLALIDDEALIRRTAVENIQVSDPLQPAKRLAPLLYDPVKAIRIEAARRLAGPPSRHLSPDQKQLHTAALHEFENAMIYSGDFAFGRYNLGNLYNGLDRLEDAIRSYQAAIEIDHLFYPAKVNLAMLYNQRGNKDDAERLFREVVTANPELYEAAYSLGLLLAEKKKYGEAAIFLAKAADGIPGRARIHYNLGLLFQQLKQSAESEAALLRAYELEPGNPDFQLAVADHYIKRGKFQDARRIAEQILTINPKSKLAADLIQYIRRMRQGG